MRGITLGVFSAQPIYDVDFQTNVLDVAQTMGYAIPPLEKRLLLNRLMKDMKNIGFFQIQDTLANFAFGITGLEQFRMIDWKKTGNIYTPHGGLIYTPEGIEGNGIDAYVDTNFNPATMGVNYKLNNASLGAVVYYDATINGRRIVFSQPFGYTGPTLIRTLEANAANVRINSSGSANEPIDLSGTGLTELNRINDSQLRGVKKNQEKIVGSSAISSLYDGTIVLHERAGMFGSNGLSMVYGGGAVPYANSQSFREIYNQFLSDSGLSPIA